MSGCTRSWLSQVAVLFHRWSNFHAVVIAALCIFIAASSPSSIAADPIVVWVGDQTILKGVNPETNQFVQLIAMDREASSVVVDPADNTIWTLQGKQLVQFDQGGSLLRRIDLSTLAQNFGMPKVLVLDPYDRSFWVVSEKALLHIGNGGNKLLEWPAPRDIQAFDLDLDGTAWTLTKKELIHVSLTGSVLATVDLEVHLNNPAQLAIDNLGGLAWIASKRKLLQFNLNDLTQAPRSIDISNPEDEEEGTEDEDRPPRIKTANIHPLAGTLWLVSRHTLYLFNRQGAIVKTVDLLPYQLGKIKTIAYDPITPAF